MWPRCISRSSETINIPAIEAIGCRLTMRPFVRNSNFLPFRRCIFGPKLFFQSQLIIIWVQLSRLEQSANFGETLSLGCLCECLLLLFFFSIHFRVVSGELFQRDEEVSQIELESVGIVV